MVIIKHRTPSPHALCLDTCMFILVASQLAKSDNPNLSHRRLDHDPVLVFLKEKYGSGSRNLSSLRLLLLLLSDKRAGFQFDP